MTKRRETPRPQTVTVRLDRAMLGQVDELAARRGWSRQEWLARAIGRVVAHESGTAVAAKPADSPTVAERREVEPRFGGKIKGV